MTEQYVFQEGAFGLVFGITGFRNNGQTVLVSGLMSGSDWTQNSLETQQKQKLSAVTWINCSIEIETGPTDPWGEPRPNHREKNSNLPSFQPLDSIHACAVSHHISLMLITTPSPQNTVVFIITLKCVEASCFAAASFDEDTNIQQTHNQLFPPMKFSACFNTQTSYADQLHLLIGIRNTGTFEVTF